MQSVHFVSEQPKETPLKILLADRQPLTAAGIHLAVSRVEGMELVDTVNSRHELARLAALHQPSILIVDYALTDFVSAGDISRLRLSHPNTKVLIISSETDRKKILEIVHSDVGGYLTKDCSLEEIGEALKSIRQGQKYYSQKILMYILDHSVGQENQKKSRLTERELQLLLLLAKGYSTLRAADELHVSPHTVHSHRKKIIRKLGIQSPTQYVIHAVEMGLMEL